MRVVVVGSGAWGTAFAGVLRAREHDVFVAGRATVDAAPYDEADLVVIAVPSRAFREVLAHVSGTAPILSLVKGLDPESGERLSTLVRDRPVAVLSGPNMAEEVAEGLPSIAVIASEDQALAATLQEAITSPVFRVYIQPDLIGVELCAAAKNPRPGRQREGRPDHARLGRDGAPRRGVRRRGGDVLWPRWDGRSDCHVLPPDRPQSAGRRDDRARRDTRRGQG